MDNEQVPPSTTPVPPTEPKPRFIFVAVYPRDNQSLPTYLEDLEKSGWNLLHPAYGWDSPEGKRMRGLLKTHKSLDVPNSNPADPWSGAAIRDYFAIRAADVMVYDTDNEPGLHFLAAAQIYQIPVVAVSPKLLSVPAYFSGIVQMVIKPHNLIKSLT